MNTFLKLIGSIVTITVILVVILFVATRKDYPVRRLVTENAGLPSQTVAGIKLHLRKIKVHPVPIPSLFCMEDRVRIFDLCKG